MMCVCVCLENLQTAERLGNNECENAEPMLTINNIMIVLPLFLCVSAHKPIKPQTPKGRARTPDLPPPVEGTWVTPPRCNICQCIFSTAHCHKHLQSPHPNHWHIKQSGCKKCYSYEAIFRGNRYGWNCLSVKNIVSPFRNINDMKKM